MAILKCKGFGSGDIGRLIWLGLRSIRLEFGQKKERKAKVVDPFCVMLGLFLLLCSH